VTQQVGPVTVTISYSSPRVVLKGNDRRGKVWGKLVPYGLTELDFNDCKSCPWRAGANENTVFTVSDEVKVQGKSLPAGSYGLAAITGPDEWTFVFSKNASSWGSYWYDPKEEALRVTAKAGKSEYHEWLTYDFVEREPAKATVALKWEELQVPLSITVDGVPARWVAKLRDELRGYTGFTWESWQRAADYCLQNKINLPEALTWAERGAGPNFGGDSQVAALATLARAQAANGKDADSAKTWDKAIALPGATAIQIHGVGRSLLAEGKNEQALRIFQMNAKRFPNQWPVHVGLMRAYAATGDAKKALEEARLALKQAPDEGNKKSLQGAIEKLEKGDAKIN
jgi:tetratricopeptide (TPR) repeat protein